MLIRNIEIEIGLVNGVIGIIVDIGLILLELFNLFFFC